MAKSLNRLEIEEKFLNWIKGIYKTVESVRTRTIMGGEVQSIHGNKSVEKSSCDEDREKQPHVQAGGGGGGEASVLIDCFF